MGGRDHPGTAPSQPPPHPTKQAKKAALTSGNVAAHTAGTICRPPKASSRRDDSTVCPRIHADRDFAGRWLVEHQGHCYPFPSYPSAVKAALNPAHLCKYGCICPVRGRESA